MFECGGRWLGDSSRRSSFNVVVPPRPSTGIPYPLARGSVADLSYSRLAEHQSFGPPSVPQLDLSKTVYPGYANQSSGLFSQGRATASPYHDGWEALPRPSPVHHQPVCSISRTPFDPPPPALEQTYFARPSHQWAPSNLDYGSPMPYPHSVYQSRNLPPTSAPPPRPPAAGTWHFAPSPPWPRAEEGCPDLASVQPPPRPLRTPPAGTAQHPRPPEELGRIESLLGSGSGSTRASVVRTRAKQRTEKGPVVSPVIISEPDNSAADTPKSVLKGRIRRALMDLSALCEEAGIDKGQLLNLEDEPSNITAPAPEGSFVASDHQERRQVTAPSSSDPTETAAAAPPTMENPLLSQLIEDISATITRKVLDNLRKEFGASSVPTSVDSVDEGRDRLTNPRWSDSCAERTVFPRRADMKTVDSVHSFAFENAQNRQMMFNTGGHRRPDVYTYSDAASAASLFARRAVTADSPVNPEADQQAARLAWIPPPRQLVFTEADQKAATPMALRTDPPAADGDHCPTTQRLQSESTTASSPKKSVKKNGGVASFFGEGEVASSVNRNDPAAGGLLPRTGKKAGRRDVVYTLRIETFQEAGSSEGKALCSPIMREVDVVRVHSEPELLVMPDFLTAEECIHARQGLPEVFKPILAPLPALKIRSGNVQALDLPIVPEMAPPFVNRLFKRILAVTQKNSRTAAVFQMLIFSPNSSCQVLRVDPARPTELIVYIFLNDASSNGNEMCFNNLGLKIKPKQGAALMWKLECGDHTAVQKFSSDAANSILVCYFS